MSTDPITLTPAADLLLSRIAEYEVVQLHKSPGGGRYLPNTNEYFGARTLNLLTRYGLVSVGNGTTDPVRLTDLGRRYAALPVLTPRAALLLRLAAADDTGNGVHLDYRHGRYRHASGHTFTRDTAQCLAALRLTDWGMEPGHIYVTQAGRDWITAHPTPDGDTP